MEQGLPAYGNCNLAHINLAKFVKGKIGNARINWDDLERAIKIGVRFLDDVIDYTKYPLPQNEENGKAERRIGLGTLGLGEMLIRCGVRYGKDAVTFINRLYRFIAKTAYTASIELAEEKGAFPLFDLKSHSSGEFFQRVYQELEVSTRKKFLKHGIRNSCVLTQAPVGSTGTMIGTSTGIEPYFSFSYWRSGRLGTNEIKEKIVQEYLDENNLSEDAQLPDYFVTAMNISPEDHVFVQGAIQKWVDSSISKTINTPNSFTIEETSDLYQLAYDMGIKGTTIYRSGSRDVQVLEVKDDEEEIVEAVDEKNPVASNHTKRPNVIFGTTEKISLPEIGKLYVTVNGTPEDGAIEVFVNAGEETTEINALCNYAGRLISVARKHGVPLEDIIKQGTKVAGGQPFWYKSDLDEKGRTIRNIPNAVSMAISRFADSNINVEHKQKDIKAIGTSKCPSCDSNNYIKEDGCETCKDCGYSKCS